ncbi:MAG: alpha/beta hydrolase [Muribaculaceae bacterium]
MKYYEVMRRKVVFLVLSGLLLACSAGGVEEAMDTDTPNTDTTSETTTPSTTRNGVMVSQTTPYPSSYATEADQRGTVVHITYNTRDYVNQNGGSRQNDAYVYLPYGYENSNRRYNIIYLVHGHYGDASTTWTAENGIQRKVLDHAIEDGVIEPVIVVSPTYNYGSPTPNYVDAGPYCRALPQELRNDLIPLVESRYRTYAETTDAAGLRASRDHRVIGGFSMGGVTTWFALDETLDLFGKFIPMSGDCWSLGSFAGQNRPTQTADYLIQRIQQQGYTANDYQIWAAAGTSDSAYREILDQIEGMATRSAWFNARNMTFHEKAGARHEFLPSVEYVYNALRDFFPGERTTGIATARAHTTDNVRAYDLQGRRVSSSYKGLVIENGELRFK